MEIANSRLGSRRQIEIIDALRETGRATVEELSARFAVTPQTIRRDLNEMSEARLVTDRKSVV